MLRTPDHLAYWLPARAAGHRPRVPGLVAGLDAIEHFLAASVAAEPTIEVRLEGHATAPWGDEAATDRARAALTARLGEPDTVHTHDLAPAGALPVPHARCVWHRTAAELPALRALLAGDAWPHDSHGPVPLTWTRAFRWRADAPGVDAALAAAIPVSTFTIRVARHVAVRPVLHFPFAAPGLDVDAFASWLAARLPFVLQPRHFLQLATARDGSARAHRLRLPPAFVVAR